MFQKIVLGVILLSLPALSCAAAQLDGTCDIRFYGDSTLHGFEGGGACEPFVLNTTDPSHGPLQVVVKVAGLDTDNGARDKKMRKMFDADKYPDIIGVFEGLDPVAKLSSWKKSEAAELPFVLTIRDVTRPVSAQVSNLEITGSTVRMTLGLELSLENFMLEPPGVLGIIRVADKVRLEIDTEFTGEVKKLVSSEEVSQP